LVVLVESPGRSVTSTRSKRSRDDPLAKLRVEDDVRGASTVGRPEARERVADMERDVEGRAAVEGDEGVLPAPGDDREPGATDAEVDPAVPRLGRTGRVELPPGEIGRRGHHRLGHW
jgi:hypothetical protein